MISVRHRSDELVCWDHATLKRQGKLGWGQGTFLGDEHVTYAYTNTRFGGRRQWFCCPSCQTPRRVLYGQKPRCRECLALVYASQFNNAFYRAISRALTVRRRFGARGVMAPFPLRPKGMHWSTYRSLERKEQELLARITGSSRSR